MVLTSTSNAQAQNSSQIVSGAYNVFPSSHQANAFTQPGAFVAPTWSELIGEHESPARENASPGLQRPSTGLGIQSTQPQGSINTRLWQALNGFARDQDGNGSGPTTNLPSTAAPSLYEEPKNNPPRTAQNTYMAPPLSLPPSLSTIRLVEEGESEDT